MEYLIILLFWLIVAAALHYRYRLKLYRNARQNGILVFYKFFGMKIY